MTEAEKRREMVEIIKEYYIPKSKIETRIKELEALREKAEGEDFVILVHKTDELKGLLADE